MLDLGKLEKRSRICVTPRVRLLRKRYVVSYQRRWQVWEQFADHCGQPVLPT